MTLSAQTSQQIKNLRQTGHSLKEISIALGIAKSSASLYCRNTSLNPQAKERITQIRLKASFQPGNTANPRSIQWTDEKVKEVKRLYDSGLSMREVGETMGLGIWCICDLMRKRKLLRRTENETRHLQFINSPLSFQPKNSLTPEEEKLKIAGLMLYWGEGAKTIEHQKVDFANSNPIMILTFCKMLRTIYQVNESRLRVNLYHFDDQDSKMLLKYWSALTQIPTEHFFRPYIRPHNPERKHDKIAHGVCHIVYSDKRLLELILSDIDKAAQQMLGYQSGQMAATVNRLA